MTPLNRRRFLKTATTGVGALALGAEQLFAGQNPTMSANAEVVVIGAGAFGGWTALYLREMGHTVTLIDQYGPGNSRATSGGRRSSSTFGTSARWISSCTTVCPPGSGYGSAPMSHQRRDPNLYLRSRTTISVGRGCPSTW